MISIITAIYNGLPVNQLFLEKLRQYTHHPFELIIIDNGSTDGSREFFKENGAIVIENKANYSYPYCQNQGIKIASYNYLAFLNNDIVVAPDWDKLIIESMNANGLDVITVCGIERVESIEASKKLRNRWNKIKNLLLLFGHSKSNFARMVRWMYGDWDKFSQKRQAGYKQKVMEGFVGNSVITTRNAIEKIGLWDERIQAADFDIFLRTKKRSIEYQDIKPCHIALDVFNHHFIRITTKNKPPQFADAANLIRLEDKWDGEIELLMKDIWYK